MLNLRPLGAILLLGVSHVSCSSERHLNEAFARQGSTGGCPPLPSCNPNLVYRTADGTCNNLNSPLDGAAGIPFIRYLPPQYENGDQPRGESFLPTARRVSSAMSAVGPLSITAPITLMVMQWGQFTDHDFTFTPEREGFQCCDDGHTFTRTDPDCRPLNVTGDSFYSQFNIQCLRFVRSNPVSSACAPAHREQFNLLTSFQDGSQVYGSSLAEQLNLRTRSGGLLKIGPGQELMTGVCRTVCPLTFLPIRNNTMGKVEFFTGDRRVEEQPGLTSIHTLFVRAHNDFANQIAATFPNYDDEKIFQETRRIIGALLQHITYNEFLPAVIGFRTASASNLLPLSFGSGGYTNGYNPSIFKPSTPNVFATTAYRFGHSLIPNTFFLANNRQVQLAQSFNNHNITITTGTYPSFFLQALGGSVAERMDHFLVDALRNKLFATGPAFSNGSDLYSRNIMRGRDHGIPPYNDWRQALGLFRLTSLAQLDEVMPSGPAQALRSVYTSVDHIDLFPAAISEYPVDSRDGILGPVLTGILATHFKNLKYGDRFFYESYDQNPKRFTREQLDIIRRTTLASLICTYTDTPFIQEFAMQVPSYGNSVRDCLDVLTETLPDYILRFLQLSKKNSKNEETA